MKKIVVTLALILCPVLGMAAGGHGGVKLDRIEVSLTDKVSLQKGAQLFVNYCLSCHSANFMRYNRMAADLEIPEELVKEHMIFDDRKIGDQMTTTMSKEHGDEWFGVAPPDLSLIGKLRDADWLYTYLRSFYADSSTASGWNNAVFPNVAMPHAMAELQGVQHAEIQTDEHGNKTVSSLNLVTPGKLSVEEFDEAMADLTNFLYYMGEPARMVRTKYGIWTLLFLSVFGYLAYLLKKEYWRDVH